MAHVRLVLFVFFLYCDNKVFAQNDSLHPVVFTGVANMEVRFGPNCMGNEQASLSCPHIIIGGRLSLLNGWSFTSEFEYEHLYDNHAWSHNLNNEFCTNALYVIKSFTDALNVKAGIVDIPVGMTNSRGPALTIDDPESEADMLPMVWHESGISLFGEYKRLAYSVTATSYLNKFEVLGLAARADYRVAESLRLGFSGYTGKRCHGMIGRETSKQYSCASLNYLSLDMNYSVNGFLLDGSMIYCSEGNGNSFGCECGYDLMFNSDDSKFRSQIISFLRYDYVCSKLLNNTKKYTIGMNIVPIPNLIFKAEYGIRDYDCLETSTQFALSLGYTVSF
ncbi:hypothetical protein [Segatella paludivivens]|uniref:hypothetical protein n=2 Tax=Segatella paludivivens TaxID=185294 RepID=UPI00036DF398|nr:hypothetical protein [Segatella paludivivens]